MDLIKLATLVLTEQATDEQEQEFYLRLSSKE